MRLGIGLGLFKAGLISAGVRIFSAFQTRVIGDGGTVEAGTCVVNGINGSALLQQASLLLIPSGYKGGKLYAEIPTNGNGDLTWTRGSDAFRTNASGLIQRVPWNLVRYSEDLTNAAWSKPVGWTITANATTSPDRNINADLVTPTNFNNLSQSSNVVASTDYTVSVYVKKETTNFSWVSLVFSGGTSINYGYVINWSTLTISLIPARTSAINPTFESVGNGWYRISFVCASGNNTSASLQIIPDSQGGTASIYIWGAQLVEGTTAQTYLPTTDRLNFPRLSYMYGSCPAVLLEPQRTNLALQSETFDNASWSKAGLSVSANTTTSPDGTSNADKLIVNNAALIAGAYVQQIITKSASSLIYSYTCYAKQSELNAIRVYVRDSISAVNFAQVYYNINDGSVITAATSGGTFSAASSTITSVANGFYRINLTFTSSADTQLQLRILSFDTVKTTGNGTDGIFIYGAQLEAGAYPTTYIPTTTATATRVADSFSRSNIFTNGLITSSGGTWFVELRGNVAYTRDGAQGIGFNDTTNLLSANGFVVLNNGGLNRLSIRKYVAGTSSVVYATTTDTTKIAIKWNGTSADVFANGTKVVTATSFTTTNMENLLGSGAGTPIFIQQMALYPLPLSDTDCTTLTTL